ncbi:MAG: DNA-binding response regulator [Spirochaetes bacterium GWF1_51_8]|nr:MAG: DNA-binding response regulator [Spirochaetes bacterium GWF1_51_8]
MKIKVALADDHPIVREGLKALLENESDIEVIGEANNGNEAVELVRKLSPNIIIMDISMPNLNGMEATRMIDNESPNTRVIALSMHHDKRFVANMLESGARGFLLKDCAAEELVEAVRTVMNGKTYLSKGIADIVVTDYVEYLKKKDQSVFGILSPREREVMQLLVEGKSTKDIASQLFLSVKTVETHRQQIMTKLGTHSIAELTKLAIREGLTSLE